MASRQIGVEDVTPHLPFTVACLLPDGHVLGSDAWSAFLISSALPDTV